MVLAVGIDDLNLYAGALAIDFTTLAAARGIAKKDSRSIQFARRSVVAPFEDPVTLAVNAAKPIVDAAGPGNFGLLIVATETGVDYGKPLSSYAHKYLGLASSCSNFEVKHACYAGTAALQAAAAWVRAAGGAQTRNRALVIMTDIARRGLTRLVEGTAGAGAVALSVTADPRLLEIEPGSGCAAREVYDVARPTLTGEWDDPVLSLGSYLDLLELAWDDYRRVRGASTFARQFTHMLYHTPLVGLIEQAHRLLVESDGEDTNVGDIAESFERMVRPGLTHNRELGNIYSGSLYAALAGLLDCVPDLVQGTRVGLFSYGSGACAELFSGLIRDGAGAAMARRHIGSRLAARRCATLAEYEAAVAEVERGLMMADFTPDRGVIPGHYEEAYSGRGLLVLEGVAHHHRCYRWS